MRVPVPAFDFSTIDMPMTPETITSLQNPRVKAIVKLREGRKRDRQERILIDGRREITRAIRAGVKFVEVFYCPARVNDQDHKDILQPATAQGAELIEVNEAVLEKASYGDRIEGIVVTAVRPRLTLDDIRLRRNPLIGIVEGLEKPGNLGAVLRSADGAGVEAIIAADPLTDIYSPNAIRASLGTIFTLPVVESPAINAISWLRSRGIGVVAASSKQGTPYADVDFTEPVAIVLGNEADGLTSVWGQPDALYATIPMQGHADSLNVSITAAVFFYEALRQRQAAQACNDRQ